MFRKIFGDPYPYPQPQVPTQTQVRVKTCGHQQCSLTTSLCCWCGDARPNAPLYEEYVDGYGYKVSATRQKYYCPKCKLKSYASQIVPETPLPPPITITTPISTYTPPRVPIVATHKKPVIPKSPTPAHEMIYSKAKPFCPHSIYPTRCFICPIKQELVENPTEKPKPKKKNNNNNNESLPPLTKLPTCVHNLCYKDCRVCSGADEENVIQTVENMGLSRADILTVIEKLHHNKQKITPEAILDFIYSQPPLASESPTPTPTPIPTSPPSLPLSQPSTLPSTAPVTQPTVFPPPSAPPIDLSKSNNNNNSNNSGNNPNKDELCIICFNEPLSGINIPCGHLGLCFSCANSEHARTGSCLICRSKVTMVVKVFKVL